MGRPCTCDRLPPPGAPYTTAYCRPCWLYHNDHAYRRLWGGDDALRLPCAALGAYTGTTADCPSCRGRVQIKLRGCAVHGRCTEVKSAPGVACCATCPDYRRPAMPEARKLLLKNHLSPGDVCMMTAALYSLHKAHPGKYRLAVDTSCDALFEHSPDVVPRGEGFEEVQTNYSTEINRCNQTPVHALQGYTTFLEEFLGVRVPLATNRPMIYLSPEERGWQNQVEQEAGVRGPFWLINAGRKNCLTAKQYPYYQRVVDLLQGRVRFVQVGKAEHTHPRLNGVIDLRGRTGDRQLVRLVYNCAGVLCPVTLLMHLAAAFSKPAVVLAGGREPRSWNQYARQTYLSTLGTLPCCQEAACWRSRTVKLGDGAEQDSSVCEQPLPTDPPAPRCMGMIRPEAVAEAVLAYYEGGALRF